MRNEPMTNCEVLLSTQKSSATVEMANHDVARAEKVTKLLNSQPQ